MRPVIAVMALVIIAATLVIALQSTFAASATGETQINESFAPVGGAVVELNESKRDDVVYNATVDVYNETGDLMSEPNDYTWFNDNGTIRVNISGNLSGNAFGNITYGYLDSTERVLRAQTILSQLPRVIGIALPLGFVFLFLRALRGG